jgi:hypothetical protein
VVCGQRVDEASAAIVRLNSTELPSHPGCYHVTRTPRLPVRIVPLSSDEAEDSYVAGTIDERLALVARLSRRAWAATGRPMPSYTRATIPVVITRLGDQ